MMTKIRYTCFVSRIPMTFFSCLETRRQGIHRSLLEPRDSWPAGDQRSSEHPDLNCNPDLCYLCREKQGIGIAKKKIHLSNRATFGPLTGQGISQYFLALAQNKRKFHCSSGHSYSFKGWMKQLWINQIRWKSHFAQSILLQCKEAHSPFK